VRPPFQTLSTLAFASQIGCLAVACGGSEPSGPEVPAGGLNVSIHVTSVVGPRLEIDNDGLATATCDLHLRAVASGDGIATWGNATIYWFIGKDRSTPVDSAPIPASIVQSAWGGANIAADTARNALWRITAGIPFGAAIDYQYRPAGQSQARTASVSFTCGPTPPLTATPPVVTSLTVRTSDPAVEPGDTVIVDFSATSQVGLWYSLSRLSGPCSVEVLSAEALANSVSRSIRLPLPSDCALGVPATVSVHLLDIGLEERERTQPTGWSLTDVTPPTISVIFFPPLGSATTEIAGDYYGDQDIAVDFHAGDNHALDALVWEVSPVGVRDSVLVSGDGASIRVPLRARSEWAGTLVELQFFARDAAGLTSEVVRSAPGAIRIYPTVERTVTSTTIEREVTSLVIDERRGLVYVLQAIPQRITALSVATLAVSGTIPLPSEPADFDLTASGDSLLVTLPAAGALAVVDLLPATPQTTIVQLTTLDPTVDQQPRFVRVLADGRAFVTLFGTAPEALTLLEVALSTGGERLRIDAGEGGYVGSAALARSFDRRAAALNGGPDLLQSYDVVADAFGPRRTPMQYLLGLRPSLDGVGRFAALHLDLYDGSLAYVRSAESYFGGNSVVPSALAPEGEDLYAVLGEWVMRWRVSSGERVDRSPNPVMANGIEVSPDGTFLITFESIGTGTSRVSRMDLR